MSAGQFAQQTSKNQAVVYLNAPITISPAPITTLAPERKYSHRALSAILYSWNPAHREYYHARNEISRQWRGII